MKKYILISLSLLFIGNFAMAQIFGGGVYPASYWYSDGTTLYPAISNSNINIGSGNITTTGLITGGTGRFDGGIGVGTEPYYDKAYQSSYTLGISEGATGLYNYTLATGNDSVFYGVDNDVSSTGTSSQVIGLKNDMAAVGAGSYIYGVYTFLSSYAPQTGQFLYGSYSYIEPHAAGVTAYGNYLLSDPVTVNDPTVNQIGLYINWKLAGTDASSKKWAIYNASTNITSGKVFLGIDDVKTYWGTGYDDSFSHDGTNMVARSEVGSHDFIFDQYSDIITGNANLDAGTGTGTFGLVNTAELYNSAGDLKIQPDGSDDVTFFQDQDIGATTDGNILYIYRYSTGDGATNYIRSYISQYQSANFEANCNMIFNTSLTAYRYIRFLSSYHMYFDVGNNYTIIFRQDGGSGSTYLTIDEADGDVHLNLDNQELSFGAGNDAKLEFTGSQFQIQSDLTTATDSLLLRGGTNGIAFNIGATEQIILTDGKLAPTTTNDIALGDSTHIFSDTYTKYISTDSNELLAHDVIRHPAITAGEAEGNTITELWSKATIEKVVSISIVVIDVSETPNLLYFNAGGTQQKFTGSYNGTTITITDNLTNFVEGDIFSIYIVYEKE